MNDFIQINDEKDLAYFLKQCNNFHDSCIFEIHYNSGAYVDEKLSMHPINSINTLTIRFHSQNEKCRRFDVEFTDLVCFNLTPVTREYSCEIFEGKLIQRDGLYYWSADDEFLHSDISCLSHIKSTWVCSKSIKWRICSEEE